MNLVWWVALFYALLTLKDISQQFLVHTFLSTIGGVDARTLQGSGLSVQSNYRRRIVTLPTRTGVTKQACFLRSFWGAHFLLRSRLLYSAGQQGKICHLDPLAQELEYLDSSSSSTVRAPCFPVWQWRSCAPRDHRFFLHLQASVQSAKWVTVTVGSLQLWSLLSLLNLHNRRKTDCVYMEALCRPSVEGTNTEQGERQYGQEGVLVHTKVLWM